MFELHFKRTQLIIVVHNPMMFSKVIWTNVLGLLVQYSLCIGDCFNRFTIHKLFISLDIGDCNWININLHIEHFLLRHNISLLGIRVIWLNVCLSLDIVNSLLIDNEPLKLSISCFNKQISILYFKNVLIMLEIKSVYFL